MNTLNSTLRARRTAIAQMLQRVGLGLVVGLALSACGSLPQPVSVDFAEPTKVQAIVAPPSASKALDQWLQARQRRV